MKNVVTFVGVLVVDKHWGGLLVNDRSLNDLHTAFYFFCDQSDSTKDSITIPAPEC